MMRSSKNVQTAMIKYKKATKISRDYPFNNMFANGF
jgi:hypothetical protein